MSGQEFGPGGPANADFLRSGTRKSTFPVPPDPNSPQLRERLEDTGVRFAGYAALFDREDRGGDIIRKGAFARAIALWRGRRVPLLWQHRPDRAIGMIESMAEDERGLRVIGRVRGDAPEEAAALLKDGKVSGLSFGYRVTRSQGHSPRILQDLDLVEVSVVKFPMQPGARVHAVV